MEMEEKEKGGRRERMMVMEAVEVERAVWKWIESEVEVEGEMEA